MCAEPSKPLISVVMPSYNSGPYIKDAVRSVLDQKGPALELLVQDGASTDGTLDVLSRFDDPRLEVISEPDAGQTDAVNRGLARARGEWLLWLNADDKLAPGALERIGPKLHEDCGVVHGHYALIDPQGEIIKRYSCARLSYARLLRYGAYLYQGAMLVRRDVYERVGRLDTSLHYAMDFEWMLRISLAASVCTCETMVAYLRVQPDSKTSTHVWAQFREHWDVAGRHGAFTPRRLPQTAQAMALTVCYILSRPLWHSRLWRRMRPTKQRGGGA